MIKRPLNSRFSKIFLRGDKTTTIRDNPWPVGVPIMLYNWSGKPYRSKHENIGTVVVSSVREIKITHRTDGGMLYAYGYPADRPIHMTEGFPSRSEMDDWFSRIVKPGETVTKTMMFFL